MADDAIPTDGPLELKEEKLHSDADFMAAIDEQISALGSKKPSSTDEAKATEAKSAPTQQSAKTEPAKAVTTPTPEEVPVEDQGERITVKTKPKPPPPPPPPRPPRPVEPPSGLSVRVNVAGAGKNNATTLSHTGKSIKPLTAEELSASKDSQETQTGVPSNLASTESKPAEQSSGPTAPAAEAGAASSAATTSQSTGTPAGEETTAQPPADTASANPLPPQKSEHPPQTLKTFDTDRYHLPIKATKHHRQHGVHPAVVFLLFLLLSILITLAAIDMGVVDLGIKLPFDIL